MMKKIILICSIVISGFAVAQNTSDNPFVYETTGNEMQQEDVVPGTPGDPVPVDQYIPALLVMAAAIATAVTYRKKDAAK